MIKLVSLHPLVRDATRRTTTIGDSMTWVARALEELGWVNQITDEVSELNVPSVGSRSVREMERKALIKTRVGQGKFRIDVIALF